MLTHSSTGVKGLEDDPSKPLDFSRRYLDQNRNTVNLSPYHPRTQR
jgi:hypothetical protein